jgi:hypothetical protein
MATTDDSTVQGASATTSSVVALAEGLQTSF